MAKVSVHGIDKSFGPVRALREVTLDFPDGELFALLGPSGSGKTTLLRIIAGFEFPERGSVLIGEQPVQHIAVENRGIGMMFQNYALFPNLNVFDNVGFGLQVRGVKRHEIQLRVQAALDLVQLSGFDHRKPDQLSGGQRQRVALARAIIVRPRVLLLDEPLSALDKGLRLEMRTELKLIQREIGITTLFVTHDQEEALTIADQVGLLRDGELVQHGPPHQLYEQPESAFAAGFLGDANLFHGIRKPDGLLLEDGSVLRFKTLRPALDGSQATVAVRPEKIHLESTDSGLTDGQNRIQATIQDRIFAGSSLTYVLTWQGQQLKVFTPNRGGEPFSIDTRLSLRWAPEHTIEVQP